MAVSYGPTGGSAVLQHFFQSEPFSTDSDDEDYNLEDREGNKRSHTKSSTKKGKKPHSKRRKKRRRFGEFNDGDCVLDNTMKKDHMKISFPKHPCHPHSDTWASLPVEVLRDIFSHVMTFEKGVRYLCRCCQVCSNWYAVASQPISWQGIADFSFMCGNKKGTDKLMEKLCATALGDIKGLDLSGWTYLTKVGVSSVAKHCQKLEHLNISNCKSQNVKITIDNIIELAEKTNLKHVNFSNTHIPGAHLISLVNIRGEYLKHIDFSQNFSVTSSLITSICKYCHILEVLNVSNTSVRSICFLSLQKCCNKLQELYLANLDLEIKSSSNNEVIDNPGFPHLKLLSLAKSSDDAFASYSDNIIQTILRTSYELNVLDLRGNRIITAEGLHFPSTKVERLFLSRTKISLHSMEIICQKWSDTLVDLDLSWNDVSEFDYLINYLVTCNDPCIKLKSINLAGSSVSDVGVKAILSSCFSLEWLDLSSCRGVTRGNKRCHNDREAIGKLLKSYHINIKGI